jgi:geranylgeranyl diphosphate synthase type II
VIQDRLVHEEIEKALCFSVEALGEEGVLKEACRHMVLQGGKRLRPKIVLMVAEALGYGLDVMPVAVGIEFFHTASLIADDLPCMDNDDYRRGQLSLHKAFSEHVAILASYALIASGYGQIHENSRVMQKDRIHRGRALEALALALETVTCCAGFKGAVQGQLADLGGGDGSFSTFSRIVSMKTSALFEAAFALGWLFGGGKSKALPTLRECAHHLGLAFQIRDDLEDGGQDQNRPLGLNAVKILGQSQAKALLEEECLVFQRKMKKIDLWSSSFEALSILLASPGSSLGG